MERMTTQHDIVLEPEGRARDYAYIDVQTDRRDTEEVAFILEEIETALGDVEGILRDQIDD